MKGIPEATTSTKTISWSGHENSIVGEYSEYSGYSRYSRYSGYIAGIVGV